MYPNQSVVTSAAADTRGNEIVTAKRQNAAVSKKRLKITLKNTTANIIENITIFPGYRAMDGMAQGQGDGAQSPIQFTAKGFSSLKEFTDYFRDAATEIEGCNIETDNVNNFANEIDLLEKYVDGDTAEAQIDLRGSRTVIGDSYQKDMVVRPEDLRIVINRYLTVKLAKLHPNSSITFSFNVIAQDRVKELSLIPTKTI